MTIGGIQIEGLTQFRRDLKAAEAAGPKRLTEGLKRAGEPIIRHLSRSVPRRSGRLADSYYATVRGTKAAIRSKAPYGAGAEWGLYGKWRGWGERYGAVPRFVWPAIEDEHDEVMRILDAELRGIITAFDWFHGGAR